MPAPECLKAAQVLWDYLKLNQPLSRCDRIIAMGSHDLRVAEHAAKLILDGWGSFLVCSGGFGRLTKDLWHKTEAQYFSQIAVQAGVPPERILIEERSTNTGENICFSRDLLEKKGISIQKVLLVHKPYMERRALATALNYWPQVDYCVSSPPISFKDYPTTLRHPSEKQKADAHESIYPNEITLDQLIHIIVGDFQRILLYPEKGFQVEQNVPEEAMASFNTLMKAGFTDQVIHNSA